MEDGGREDGRLKMLSPAADIGTDGCTLVLGVALGYMLGGVDGFNDSEGPALGSPLGTSEGPVGVKD